MSGGDSQEDLSKPNCGRHCLANHDSPTLAFPQDMTHTENNSNDGLPHIKIHQRSTPSTTFRRLPRRKKLTSTTTPSSQVAVTKSSKRISATLLAEMPSMPFSGKRF